MGQTLTAPRTPAPPLPFPKASRIAQEYGANPSHVYNHGNYGCLAGNGEVDAVYIALPNGMHTRYTVRAFQAAKHVFSKKPMANTVADCGQMIAAGRAVCERGRPLQPAYPVEPVERHAG